MDSDLIKFFYGIGGIYCAWRVRRHVSLSSGCVGGSDGRREQDQIRRL